MIKKLYIEPASVCNLNCRMCFRNNWFDEEQGIMKDSVLEKIYESINIKSIQTVMLAGMGEPLLHSRASEIIRNISKAGKKAELLTNATLLDKNMSRKLLDSGLDMLWVSIDNLHAESADSSFNAVVENIKNFNKLRGDECRLGFTFVLSEKENVDNINSFAEKYGCDEINISGAIPSAPVKEIYNFSKREHKNYCPFIEEGKCFIKWNGDVSPCMQLLHSSYTYLFEEKRKVTAYKFGNILNDSLENIWNSKEYTDFRNRVKNFEFPDCTLCDGCDDRKENMTDCMFNEMPTCGACLWAQNVARCP